MALFPRDVEQMLDVGCGTGAISRRLLEAGYIVEGVSPDPHGEEAYRVATGGRAPFHLAKFEDLSLDGRTFDLILMAESCQYIKVAPGFAQAARFLRDGGYLLVSDYFVKGRKEPGCLQCRSGHELGAYLRASEGAGFILRQQGDITSRVLPTLDLARIFYQSYVEPARKLGAAFLSERHPWLSRVLWCVLGKRIRKLEDNVPLLDSAAFARCKSYLTLLFQRAG
jgi:SAM-dependent methyltransferase